MVDYNKIYEILELPSTLESFGCSNNNLTKLPVLPDRIISLAISYNNLPQEYNFYDRNMQDYINRIRILTKTNKIINFTQMRNLPSNARNYINYENIQNSNKMVNLPRINDKYNSNFQEYMKYNSWTYLPKKYENPMSKKKFTNKNLKFYTAKIKRNDNSGKRAKIERTRKNK